MTTSFLLVGDLHFGIKDDENFLQYQIDTWDWILDTAQKNGAEIIQFGDVLDKRREINFKLLSKVREQFRKLIDREIIMHYISGNHDVYYKNTNTLNSVDLLFEENPNILKIIHKPALLKKDILLVPWMSPENSEECLNIIKTSKAKYCCGHFEIAGFPMTKGFECEKGLSVSVFKKFSQVFSGHFHVRSLKGNINYIGTPFELNWNDWNDPKQIILFDVEDGSTNAFENPRTMFHRISVDDKTDFKKLIKDKEWEQKIVKVVFNCEPSKDAEKFLAHIEQNVLALDIINNFEIMQENTDIEVKSFEIDELFDEYTSLVTFPESVNKKNVRSLFQDIYKEASVEKE